MVNQGDVTVKHEPVKWPEPSNGQARAAKLQPNNDRYDLATALRIVRRMETTAGRAAVFAEIKRKNALYRLVDALYAGAGSRMLQPLILLVYMLKCVLSPGPFDTVDATAVSISQFDNEHRTIDRLAALVPGVHLLRLSLRRRHLVDRGQLRAARRLVCSTPRLWSFLARLVRSHSFMPSARIASALAFYMRFAQLFEDQPALMVAIVASNYSPEAVGMAAAAHQAGRQVVYMNHAPVPANGPPVPPVLADCAVFYGDVIRKTYERRSRCRAKVALIGQPWVARPMEWREEFATVGIFLTSGTQTGVVSDLVAAIRATRPGVRILIRNHPVALLRSDFSDLAARYDNLAVTYGNPLDDEIEACDLIICGNSGVAMNTVSAGRPVAYMPTLDVSEFDYNGFVENGLVCHVTGWSESLYDDLREFYSRPRWQSVMRSYDAAYDADVAELERVAAEIVRPFLIPMASACE